MNIALNLKPENARGSLPAELTFGAAFADHMFAQDYEKGVGWQNARIEPMQNFSLHPAASILHYGQEVFEGQKAYRARDGRLLMFRPDQNALRFNRSAIRLSMPTVDVDFHVDAIRQLVRADERWVPSEKGASLYIRPTMIATSPKLGLGSAEHYTHFVITSPVGSYFKSGMAPVSVFVSEECRRAVKGGVGEAKTGGNYAASLFVSEAAQRDGYSQVLWLDAIEGRFVEEVGAMNIFFVYKDGSIATPSLSGSILPGITRMSVIELAPTLGYPIREDRLDINEIASDIDSGKITEVFGSGTAAVISPINTIRLGGKDYTVANGDTGPVSKKIFDTLTAIQFGESEDKFGWVVTV